MSASFGAKRRYIENKRHFAPPLQNKKARYIYCVKTTHFCMFCCVFVPYLSRICVIVMSEWKSKTRQTIFVVFPTFWCFAPANMYLSIMLPPRKVSQINYIVPASNEGRSATKMSINYISRESNLRMKKS